MGRQASKRSPRRLSFGHISNLAYRRWPADCQPRFGLSIVDRSLGCTFSLAKSWNQFRSKAVYQSKGPRNGCGTMELLDLELARARQRLNRAELALERANEMLEEDDYGV